MPPHGTMPVDRFDRRVGQMGSVSDANAPIVSVVIPAYGAEAFIEEAIGSIREQSYRPIEVVVVEDCSPDRTAEVVAGLVHEWSEPGFEIRLLQQPVNSGGAAALSRGFKEAKGDYLCWLSADDAFVAPSKLAEQVAQLRSAPGISYARSYLSGPSPINREHDRVVDAMWDPARPYMERVMQRCPRARLIGLLFRNPINGSTVMIDRETWHANGNFDAILGNIDQDSDLWMRYSALGVRVSVIESLAGFYRIHPGQTSNLRTECMVAATARRIRILLAYERTGRLGVLLSRTLPILVLVHRWRWYVERPIVAEYLCGAGLRSSRNPLVRRVLTKLSETLRAENLVDRQLAEDARILAEETYASGEFQSFITRLGSRSRI